ncbi:MAG TPA: translocation/assembly module TamB domain-containing protein, partial [Acetobacteraceae bacterium]
DITARTLTLHVDANAPAMAPRPDLAWQAVTLKADVTGAFTAPDVTAMLRAEGLRASGGGAQTVVLDARGNKGDVRVSGQLDGVTVPGKQPDILATAPLRLDAEAHLSEPGRPVIFALHHLLLEANGTAKIDTEQGTLDVTLPDLAPFAAEAGETLAGHAALHMTAARGKTGALALDLAATLAITGGAAPAPALIGDDAHVALAAQVQDGSIALSKLTFDGREVSLSGSGTVSSSHTDLTFAAALAHLGPVDPRLAGALKADGHISGSATDLAIATTLSGDVGLKGQPSGPFTAQLDAHGLPAAPAGSLTVKGALLDSPIDVALSGEKAKDGTLRATIARADWKSLAATGAVDLPAGATLPQGQLRVTIGRLADFTPLLGRPLTGSIAATLDATAAAWRIEAQATDAGEPGTASIRKAVLRVTLDHPNADPAVDGTLSLDGLKTGQVSGSAQLSAKGRVGALGLTLAANLANLDGAPARAAGKGTADVAARQLTLASFSGAWKGQDVRLLAPVRLGFAQGVTIDNLRLGLARAVIEVNGRVGQTLDLTARLRDVPASLAALASPSLALSGTLNADAKLGGTPAAPTGTVHARATGLRLDTPTGHGLTPADVTATADLQGGKARIDLRATAGASRLNVAGTAGLSLTAPLDLRADASLDLAQADPLLAAGTRATGHVTLAAAITGTASQPAGTVRADAARVRLLGGPGAALPPASLTAVATLRGTSARLDARMTAGASHLALAGTAGLSRDGPLDLRGTGTIDLALANPVLQASGKAVRGMVAVDTTVRGTLAAPRLAGGATLTGGDVRDYAAGVHLSAVTARVAATEGGVLRIVSFDAHAGHGTMAARGSVGLLAPGIPIDLTITARDASPIASDLLTATLGADLSIKGQLEGATTLGGRVEVSRAVVQVPNKLPASVVTIPVRIAGAPPPKPIPRSKMLADLALNLTIAAPRQIYVRGRGLNAELGGTVRIGGTTQAMRTSGGFKLIRGSFNLVGNTLNFDSGDIDFNGTAITDPALHLVATSVGSNMVATLTVSGTARDPKVTLSSVPPLPQDQILAQLLFHTNAGALGPFQLASIAAGLAQISGQGSALSSPLQGLQNTLGLDQLGVGTGPNGQPTLQAGRYLTKGIYVGAQQAAGGAGAQAKVQVDLTKGLKLNATVGNGEATSAIGSTGASSGASVGLTYQFEY